MGLYVGVVTSLLHLSESWICHIFSLLDRMKFASLEANLGWGQGLSSFSLPLGGAPTWFKQFIILFILFVHRTTYTDIQNYTIYKWDSEESL